MRNIIDFDKFVNETLKSDKVNIVVRKLDSLFSKFGLTKEVSYFSENQNSYNITTDVSQMERLIRGGVSDNFKQELEKFIKEFTYGDISITIKSGGKTKLISELISLIESVGYFISVLSIDGFDVRDKSKIDEYLYKGGNNIFMMIEPNYDEKVSFKGKYLYHTTDLKSLNKILKYGLIPKSKNTRSFYPSRIYLSPSEEMMLKIQQELKGDKAGDYVNLRIDNFEGLSLYKDLRYKGGFFTYDNIHPKYIEVLK